MSLIRKHVAVLQAWACLAVVLTSKCLRLRDKTFGDLQEPKVPQQS